MHLELVSDLTTEAFIASLRRFVARRGKPSLLWSDHGSNFIGAVPKLKELFDFLHQQGTQGAISDFCSTHNIVWKFIPEHAPHFGGLWEAAVKSTKHHLKRIVGSEKLTRTDNSAHSDWGLPKQQTTNPYDLWRWWSGSPHSWSFLDWPTIRVPDGSLQMAYCTCHKDPPRKRWSCLCSHRPNY